MKHWNFLENVKKPLVNRNRKIIRCRSSRRFVIVDNGAIQQADIAKQWNDRFRVSRRLLNKFAVWSVSC